MQSRIGRGLIIAAVSGLALIASIVGARVAGVGDAGHALATSIGAEVCELSHVGVYTDDGRPAFGSILTCWDVDWNLSVPGAGGHH
jgi:hypothetical protein